MAKIRPIHLTLTIGILYAVWVMLATKSPLGIVTPGTRFSPDEAYHYSAEGYDGQFTYYIARDLLGAAPLIDVPAYRYQRILLPILGWLLAFGYTPLLPYTLLLVNLVGLGLGTWALEALLAEYRVSRWWALGWSLSLVGVGCIRLTLPEPLAYGLCLLGLLAIQRGRLGWAVLAFALAALAKETTLILAAAVGLHGLLTRKVGWALLFGAGALIPFGALQALLYGAFGSWGIGSGGAQATDFEILPLMGVIRILTEGNVRVFGVLMALIGPFVLLPTVWGLWRCWQDVSSRRWTPLTTLLLFSAAIMLFVPFSTYREPLGILRFIGGLQVALILYSAERRQRRALRYCSFWALTTLVLLVSDVSSLG